MVIGSSTSRFDPLDSPVVSTTLGENTKAQRDLIRSYAKVITGCNLFFYPVQGRIQTEFSKREHLPLI